VPRILLVEDEEKLRRVTSLQLEGNGYQVLQAGTAEDAFSKLDEADLVITDLRLPAQSGFDLLKKVKETTPHKPVIVITAFGNIETAVEAMKAGALDFVQKPFALDHLSAVVAKAANLIKLQNENQQLKQELAGRYQFDNIVGRSPLMQEIFATVVRVAASRATVLIAGESGVGKDMIARAVHFHSPRAAKPFVKIDCTALPENLMESELFGYEKGAFTGAAGARVGKFEQADGGTVFLDEIGDVPPQIQVKLLRILQEREFERLGSNQTRKIDVRVIAATNVDLRRALEEGRFRQDLYYRLNVVPLNMPPLRDRKEDIPYLVDHFIAKHAEPNGSPVREITAVALEKLMSYHWPGNVRELENVMERSLVLCDSARLDSADIRLDASPKKTVMTDSFLPEGVTLDQHEEQLIREAMRRASNNKSQAARLLGITRNALRYRLTQIGIEDNGSN
jgi:DNA-binding NtrC family response regulator